MNVFSEVDTVNSWEEIMTAVTVVMNSAAAEQWTSLLIDYGLLQPD